MINDLNAPVGVPAVPRLFHQLGILVLDGSGSMEEKSSSGGSKAKEVNGACIELFNRLNASRVKQNFSFACVKFDLDATTTLLPLGFDLNTLMGEDFDPTKGKGKGTHIFSGLEEAEKLANDFLQQAPKDGVPHKVLILLMSDGMCFEPDKTLKVADRIKEKPNVIVASAYFAQVGNTDRAAQQLLKEISSQSGNYFTIVYDGEALRNFFERSISQSAGLNQGKNGLTT